MGLSFIDNNGNRRYNPSMGMEMGLEWLVYGVDNDNDGL